MEWMGEGFVVGVAPYGEGTCLVDLLTPTHGRYRGMFRPLKKKNVLLQLGRRLNARWRARLETQLGTWRLEDNHLQPIQFATLLDHPMGLQALLTVCALSQELIPERQLYPRLYQAFEDFLQTLSLPVDDMLRHFFQFNLMLLQELGYGFDLKQCAVTGEKTHLTHVSPKTGRGVCAAVAALYPGKLIPLPRWLGEGSLTQEALPLEAETCFNLVLFFMKKWLFQEHSKALKLLVYFQSQTCTSDKMVSL